MANARIDRFTSKGIPHSPALATASGCFFAVCHRSILSPSSPALLLGLMFDESVTWVNTPKIIGLFTPSPF
jgi:hypothetical protein